MPSGGKMSTSVEATGKDVLATLPDELVGMIAHETFKYQRIIWNKALPTDDSHLGLLRVSRRMRDIGLEALKKSAIAVIEVNATPAFGCSRAYCYNEEEHIPRGYCECTESDEQQQDVLEKYHQFRRLRIQRRDNVSLVRPGMRSQAAIWARKAYNHLQINLVLGRLDRLAESLQTKGSTSNIQDICIDLGPTFSAILMCPKVVYEEEFEHRKRLVDFANAIRLVTTSKGRRLRLTFVMDIDVKCPDINWERNRDRESHILVADLAKIGVPVLPRADANDEEKRAWRAWYSRSITQDKNWSVDEHIAHVRSIGQQGESAV